MSTVNTDYSNTIFYKIYCKDPSIKDLYIGHTTNFVQRKHSHKQSCINPNSVNYNCKLYRFIRDNMGWDNWTMDIIAFHKCEDLQSAKVQEQYYFKEYNATLNSGEPSPTRKPKKQVSVKPPKEELYCHSCKVYFNTRKLFEEHNKRPRHIKLTQTETTNMDSSNTSYKYCCNDCNFNCIKKYDYERHISSRKHMKICQNTQNLVFERNNTYSCDCGNIYKHQSGLYRHRKNCSKKTNQSNVNTTDDKDEMLTNTILALVKENQEFKQILKYQHDKIMEISGNIKNNHHNTINNLNI